MLVSRGAYIRAGLIFGGVIFWILRCIVIFKVSRAKFSSCDTIRWAKFSSHLQKFVPLAAHSRVFKRPRLVDTYQNNDI